jgi:hypothetical protein
VLCLCLAMLAGLDAAPAPAPEPQILLPTAILAAAGLKAAVVAGIDAILKILYSIAEKKISARVTLKTKIKPFITAV